MANDDRKTRRDFCLGFSGLVTRTGSDVVGLVGEVRTERILFSQAGERARNFLLAPGSTLKPLIFLGLLESRKLEPRETYFCPGHFEIAGRQLNCSHPRLSVPVDISLAISYSCNCAIAHFSSRFSPKGLSEWLGRYGLNARTKLSVSALQLLALGEEGIQVTPLQMLRAYRNVARVAVEPRVEPVLSGLEGAVRFGTAQNARLERIQVAGKTGTVRAKSGNSYGWFAGFAPSRNPEVVVTVLVPGRSGGSDAAPLAARLLRNYFAERS